MLKNKSQYKGGISLGRIPESRHLHEADTCAGKRWLPGKFPDQGAKKYEVEITLFE